ncbi:MAG: glycosyltransferase family 2 protein [Candidatus Aminicenantes bacterium]|nr:glycosyltransferase family 2 protein [Candidatus Aminicenantes bacterium]
MYKKHKIGVVVPAYNEENLILDTLSGMPSFVDVILVVNDASTDNTLSLLEKQKKKDKRICIIDHKKNRGLGQSLIDGYIESKKRDIDITAVMAGDNQMFPDDLPNLLDKIIDEEYNYVKGNRLLHREIKNTMPRHRFFGNAILTILTKFATGYFFIMDPQCGYTAIANDCLKRIPIENMTKRYGYNADILCMLNIRGFKAADCEVKPVYGEAKSKIKLWKYIPKTSFLLIRLFFRRLWKRYVVLDFHPLILFYLFSLFNTLFLILPFTIRFFYMYSKYNELPKTTLTILIFTFLITFQSVLFAIWMDMDYNKRR